ncbi:MAG: VWA domain-containing protein [Terriglobus roseus]|nr:VWA domain-containing protein [Terriglobus roseus]
MAVLPVCVRAQEAPSPGGPPPASTAPAPAQSDEDLPQGGTIRVRTNLVNTYFSARDKGGFLTGLHKDDCQVFENREPQVIKNFTQEKNLPLTIGILLDTSGSMQNVLPLEKDAAADFLRDVIKSKDEAFLINFDINVDLLADYTNSTRELRRGLDKAEINTGAGTGSVTGNSTPRGTLLYDAVYLATHDKLRQEAGRKVVVMLTDGDDQGSQVKLKEAIEAAQKANTIVYVILIRDSGGFFGGGYNMSFGAGAMDDLTKETGGRVINGGNGKHLDEAFQQISDELRTQYLLSYTPKDAKADGTFRTINITCGNGVKIQARKGYYAVADNPE